MCTKQARCAVIAAANPIGGRYDASYSFAENVELTDPILQRFDCLCVLQDTVDPVADEKLALFVANSHIRSHPNASREVKNSESNNMEVAENDNEDEEKDTFIDASIVGGPGPIDQSLLKKYIAYARSQVKPILHDVDSEKVIFSPCGSLPYTNKSPTDCIVIRRFACSIGDFWWCANRSASH